MAPRKINDDAALLSIAHHTLDNPKAKFSVIFRQVAQKIEIHVHSRASARKRLQRKFTSTKSYWLNRAREERREEREAFWCELQSNIDRMAEKMRPIAEAHQRHMSLMRPALEALNAQFQSPQWQDVLQNAARMQARLRRIRLG